MHRRFLLALTAAAFAACNPRDQVAVSAPQFAHVQDLEGTPDLIVDATKLATSWVVYDQELKESFCSVEEADLAPGRYRVLRFTVNTPNVGDADVFIGSPWAHMDPNNDGSFADSDGLFEESTCHQHFHFRNYALYQLIDAQTGKVFRARKNGFCMIDITPWAEEVAPGSWVYRSCGNSVIRGSGNQGISVGYGDEYFKWLGGQYFVLEGDPDAENIPPGQYILRIHVNPPFTPSSTREPCPAQDPQGFCHMFTESDYSNNVGEALVTLPTGRPGKTGYGPGGGQVAKDEAIDGENRPTK
jgi:Lysyl oxidase